MSAGQDDWSLKEYRRPGSPEVWLLRKNLAPEVSFRHPDYKYLVYLTVKYVPRDDSGLPSAEDNAVLAKVEEAALEKFSADRLAVQVAAVTKAGVRDLLYYTRDPHEILNRAEAFRFAFSQFQVSCEVSPDPKWSQYEDLP
jgi:hypothetical protein